MAEKKHKKLRVLELKNKSGFWTELEKKYKGKLIVVRTIEKDLVRFEMKFEYQNASLTFTETETTPLFVKCVINETSKFSGLEISKTDFIESILNVLSQKKVNSDNEDFNKKYIVKAKNKQEIKLLLDAPNITEQIMQQNITYIGGQQKKNGDYKLDFNVHRNVNSFEQLEEIYSLAINFIIQLAKVYNM